MNAKPARYVESHHLFDFSIELPHHQLNRHTIKPAPNTTMAPRHEWMWHMYLDSDDEWAREVWPVEYEGCRDPMTAKDYLQRTHNIFNELRDIQRAIAASPAFADDDGPGFDTARLRATLPHMIRLMKICMWQRDDGDDGWNQYDTVQQVIEVVKSATRPGMAVLCHFVYDVVR